MSKIKILSEQLTNKIAAGEVVQRPSSIVKELVENSVDSLADDITVVIRNGGKTLVKVIDNGSGMTGDDLLLSFERYATSKISSKEDLMQIKTLGFRGEALASIAAVSRVIAITTPKGGDVGHELRVNGGSFREMKPHSPKPGTSISVNNLFFNVPARRKFLKSKDVEFRHIVEVIRKFALIHPRIKYLLVHNDNEVLNLRRESLKERIGNLFTPKYSKNLLHMNFSSGAMKLTGYVGNLNLIRARSGEQFLFVNGRFVTDRLMNHAITAGYSGLLSRGEFPFFCLHLTLPPEIIDVNVHPTKMEVKFRNQNAVYNFLKNSVQTSLKDIAEVAPALESFSPKSYYSPPQVSKAPAVDKKKSPVILKTPASPQPQVNFTRKDPSKDQMQLHYTQQIDKTKWEERAKRFSERPVKKQDADYQPDIQVYQLHRKYIISQVKSGLVIIDQHVAHERILFEEARKSMEQKEWSAQQLLFPQVLELSLTDLSVLVEVLPFLEKLGFRLKEFGKQSLAIEAVPSGMHWGNEGNVIREILDHYQSYGAKDTSIQSKVAASYACKAAIKAGDSLTQEEMRSLLDKLFATENPYFCPHGRPIIINLTLKELDKRFERT